MPRAASIYKQVRVTLTEQRDPRFAGRVVVSVRVMVKPVNVEWSERHTVLTTSAGNLPPLATLDEVYAALLETLAHPPLPESLG